MSVPDPDHLFRAITHRRSIGLDNILPDAIDLTQVEQIVEAANWGQSHGRTEPWRFNVYAGEQARRALGEVLQQSYVDITPPEQVKPERQADWGQRPLKAPVWISLGMYRHPTVNKFPEWEDIVAFGTAVHNMHLMASAFGLAARWTSGGVVTSPRSTAHVGLEAPSKLFGFMYLGKPSAGEWPVGERRPLGEKVQWLRE